DEERTGVVVLLQERHVRAHRGVDLRQLRLVRELDDEHGASVPARGPCEPGSQPPPRLVTVNDGRRAARGAGRPPTPPARPRWLSLRAQPGPDPSRTGRRRTPAPSRPRTGDPARPGPPRPQRTSRAPWRRRLHAPLHPRPRARSRSPRRTVGTGSDPAFRPRLAQCT